MAESDEMDKDESVDPADLAPDPADVTAVSLAVGQLLAHAGISRVVCVDDRFALSLDDVLVDCSVLGLQAGAISALASIDFSAPPERWRAEVTRLWESLDRLRQTDIAIAVRAASDDGAEAGQLNAESLEPLIPESVEFVPMSGTEWVASGINKVVAEAESKPTLVLFDQLFENEDIDRDGVALLVALLQQDQAGLIWTGLLTHTITKDSEDQARQDLLKEGAIPPERFVVVSKQHLGPNPATLPQALKVALMAPASSVLANEVSTAIRTAAESAATQIAQLAPLDFEQLVFGLSADEGVWEPDTLLRLFAVLMRVDLRAALFESETVKGLTNRLRSVASVPVVDIGRVVPSAKALEVHRLETYEEAGHLNDLHLPIQLGDIFRKVGGTAEYVLVAQPCDLMVRAGGKRAPDREELPLVEIESAPAQAELETVDLLKLSRSGGPGDSVGCFELPGYYPDGQSGWVQFGRQSPVPVEALDYCVFNVAGRSTIDVSPDSTVEGLWPVWEDRRGRLAAEASKKISAVANSPAEQRDHVKRAMFRCHASGLVNATVTGTSASYNLERVRRVLDPYAKAMLTKYGNYIAREAFEKSFAS